MNTLAIRKALKAALDEHGTSYYGQAPESASFPYIVFDFEVQSYRDFTPTSELIVWVMDYGRSTAAAEEMADAVQKGLDHVTLSNDDVLLNVYFDERDLKEAQDRNVVARRLRFSFNSYERK